MVAVVIILGISLAVLFDFANGLNDAANSIATIVATRALSPMKAVVLAAFFNLVGPLVFTTAIAATIGKGIVDPSVITPYIILAGLSGAVIWVLVTSLLGIPISSSHSLVGGLLGAGIAGGGLTAILWPQWETVGALIGFMALGAMCGAALMAYISYRLEGDWKKQIGIGGLAGLSLTVPLLIAFKIIEVKGILAVVAFIVISPMLGLISAYIFGLVIMRICHSCNPSKLNGLFKPLQIIAGSFQAIGHGANDAQNAMGIITALLLAGGVLTEFEVPLWVILTSCTTISLGTLLGGWRVVDKMAHKITKIRPYQGFSASTAGGLVLSVVTAFGVPVSTTHAMAGSIMGAGATRGYLSAVKWGIVREIVAAWVITIPASALVSFGVYAVYASIFL